MGLNNDKEIGGGHTKAVCEDNFHTDDLVLLRLEKAGRKQYIVDG